MIYNSRDEVLQWELFHGILEKCEMWIRLEISVFRSFSIFLVDRVLMKTSA
jgi:hypothetical protein